MPWPTPQDYNEAVQNPQFAFSDSDLRVGQPELNQLGLPRPRSGSFACVYKMQSGARFWAARCFLREVPDIQRRYDAISECLRSAELPYTVPFTYISIGIKVRARAYPLLKMEWIQGESLNTFVGRTLSYPATLLSLAKVWLQVLADLKALNVAHGDLQHDNILVVGNQLRLIDYDGMFVPALAGSQSNELGHRNYQLPSRSTWDYGPYLDNFSGWVIYVSLAALAVHPELWRKYRGGDQCLIFRKEDFVNPGSSGILRDLRSSHNEQLRFLVDLFTSLFFLSPQDVPALDGNLPEVKPVPVKPWWDDFVQSTHGPQEEPVPSVEPQKEALVDPGWIIDSLTDDRPVDLVAFQSKPEQLRIAAIGSMALVFLIGLFSEMPPSEIFLWASFVFGMNVLLCVARWVHDPSRADFGLFKKESKTLLRRIRQHEALMDSIRAERATIQEELAKTERKLLDQKRRIIEGLQSELAKNQADLNAQLVTLNQRRQQTRASETASLNSLQATLGSQVFDLDRRIAAINQREADEINKAISAVRDPFIQTFLRNRPISRGWIPGVSSTYKSRLAASGFTTAADITWSVQRVHGIGPTRARALMDWRRQVESEAMAAAPTISPLQKAAIQARCRQDRQNLEIEEQRLQAQLNTQITSTRQHFAGFQQSLNDEEQRIRTANTQKRDQISADYNSRVAAVELERVAAQNRAAPTVDELSEKLRAAQKQSFALHWEAAKHSSTGRRFTRLRFRDYVGKIISL